jgi:glycosyltransferase involved in cell wall biosynthesis
MQVFVIPAFNEEENLPRLLHDLEARRMLWQGGHVVLVDDGSSDGTVAVAQAYAGPVPLILVRQIRNQGAGRAFDRGFRLALELCDDDDFVVTLESDTTSDLDALESMLERARAGADVVLASVRASAARACRAPRRSRCG